MKKCNSGLGSRRSVPWLVLLAMPLGAAHAQEVALASDSTQLQTVTITATRKVENIQNVPVSASAISDEALDVLSSSGEDVRLLASRVPSLNAESSFGRAFPRFYIRGYGNTDFNLNASQPVSLIYDDVVQENPILKGFPIFDLDQVEVLRGPQGSLFGRNTPAGVVKFDSAKPTDEFGGYLNVSDGTFNTGNIEAAVNIPISPELALRISGLYQHRDNYVTNAYDDRGRAYEGYDDQALRAQLLYKPSSDFDALFNIHARLLDGTARLFRGDMFVPGTNAFVPGFSPGTVSLDGDNIQSLHSYGSNLRMNWKLGDIALHSITGYESVGVFSKGDIDGLSSYDFGAGQFPDETAAYLPHHKQLTQELRADSSNSGPLNWQAGLYYFFEDYTLVNITYANPTGPTQSEYIPNRQRNIAYAGFGSLTYDVTDALNVRAGLRLTEDKKYFDTPAYTYTAAYFGGPIDFGVDPHPPAVNTNATKLNWDVAGTYKITHDANVYARVATGFRAPSIEVPSAFNDESVAHSENVVSYEIGTKMELLQHRVRINFDLFDYDVHGFQLTAVGGQSNSTELVNAAKVIGHGAELETQLRPIPQLLITLGGSYNFTKIQDPKLQVGACGGYPTAPLCTEENPQGPAGYTVLVNGNPLPQAPKLDGAFTLRYGIPVGPNGEVYLYTDWTYRSSVDFFIDKEAEFTGQPYLLGGLRLGYTWDGGKYDVAAFSRNITNRIVSESGINFDDPTGMINDPRIFGAQIKARFGS